MAASCSWGQLLQQCCVNVGMPLEGGVRNYVVIPIELGTHWPACVLLCAPAVRARLAGSQAAAASRNVACGA